jgi:predicted nucleic acid-binding Zn ribbon protein
MTRSNEALLRQKSLLPRWAVALAAIVFLTGMGGLLYLFHAHESNPPPLLVLVPFCAFMAFLPALWVLVVGHVNHDARRRGLNAWLWTLVAALTPNALGAIVYYAYVFWRPLQGACPACGKQARAGSQFCASCGERLRLACPACGKAVEAGDVYCVSCGRSLRAAMNAG